MTNKPIINVTPLIDVLLVLLIIFMIVSPNKPTNFKTKVPQEDKQPRDKPNPYSLIVTVNSDDSLLLNNENAGSVQDAKKLTERLARIFSERKENLAFAEDKVARNDLSEDAKTEKTIFIKAPRSLNYGNVVKVVDAVKIAGANPISLQIDDLK